MSVTISASYPRAQKFRWSEKSTPVTNAGAVSVSTGSGEPARSAAATSRTAAPWPYLPTTATKLAVDG